MANPNSLFAVFSVSDPAAVEQRLASLAPWLFLPVGNGEWLIVAPSATTTKELSDKLGMSEANPVTNGIVVRVDGYFGRAATSTWEWIAAKLGAELGSTTIR